MLKTQGQSLAEYGLAGLVVAVASIAAFTAVGNSLINTTNNVVGGNQGSQILQITYSDGSSAFASITDTKSGGIGGVVPPAGAGEEHVCLESGLCINAQIFDPGTNVTDTSGGLGGELTRKSAQIFLDQLIPQLEAAGEDPALISLIRDLAEKGHDLADAQNEYDNMCHQTDTGWCGIPPSRSVNASSLYYQADRESRRLDTRKSAIDSYFLNNPGASALMTDVQNIINFEYNKIVQVHGGIDRATGDPIPTAGDPSDPVGPNDWSQIERDINRAELTEFSSNNICNTSSNPSGCVRMNYNN